MVINATIWVLIVWRNIGQNNYYIIIYNVLPIFSGQKVNLLNEIRIKPTVVISEAICLAIAKCSRTSDPV